MTRESFIEEQLTAAKASIRSTIESNGKKPADWDNSWAIDSIFPEIYQGMLSEVYGNVWDLLELVNAQALVIANHKNKINEIIDQWNTIVPFIQNTYNVTLLDKLTS